MSEPKSTAQPGSAAADGKKSDSASTKSARSKPLLREKDMKKATRTKVPSHLADRVDVRTMQMPKGSWPETLKRIPYFAYDESKGAWGLAPTRDSSSGGEQPALGKRVRVLTYNIWFSKFKADERFKAVGDIIAREDPDVVMLQEVESWIIEMLLDQPWSRRYFVTDIDGRTLARYGVMILSKIPFSEVVLYPFPTSKYGRKLLLCRVPVADGKAPLVVGTFHLDSLPNDAPERKNQIEHLNALTSPFQTRVLCGGDTNMYKKGELKALDGRFSDAWEKAAGQGEEGATFSTIENGMNAKMKGYKARRRIDRLWYTQGLRPASARRIGTKPIAKDLWPSDHFGLVCDFDLD